LRNAAFVVLAATPFSGCNPPRPPAEVVEPTMIGVVESIAHDPRGRILLVDGTEITWDQVAFEITTRPGSEGDLAIYGTDPIDGGEAPWLIMVPPSVATVGEGSEARPACYHCLRMVKFAATAWHSPWASACQLPTGATIGGSKASSSTIR
jgi:hypothetical protein